MAQKKAKNASRSYKERSKRVAIERKVRAIYRRAMRVTIVFTVLGLFAGAFWMWKEGIYQEYQEAGVKAFYDYTADAGLMLETVYIDGTNYLEDGVIRSALPEKEIPLMSLSLPILKRTVENIGWVEAVEIQRKLPNQLHLHVTERVPQAIWQYNGNLHLIDRNGAVISLSDIVRFSYLPVIVGEEANLYASSLLTFLMEEPELMHRISSIILVSGRRWNVRFKNGIEVKLPEEQPDVRWRYLAKMQRESRILDREIRYIDLRNADAIYVTVNDDQA